jgi:hypothetical protein
MHDSRGAALKVGDRVLLEGELTQVCDSDNGYCNCNVKIVTPDQRDKPPMDPPSLSAINTRMLTKVGAALLLIAACCLAIAPSAEAHNGFGFRAPVRAFNPPAVTVINQRRGVFGVRRSTTVIQANGTVVRFNQ